MEFKKAELKKDPFWVFRSMLNTYGDQELFDIYKSAGLFYDEWELNNAMEYVADKILLE